MFLNIDQTRPPEPRTQQRSIYFVPSFSMTPGKQQINLQKHRGHLNTPTRVIYNYTTFLLSTSKTVTFFTFGVTKSKSWSTNTHSLRGPPEHPSLCPVTTSSVFLHHQSTVVAFHTSDVLQQTCMHDRFPLILQPATDYYIKASVPFSVRRTN